jgi:hypothetical protein
VFRTSLWAGKQVLLIIDGSHESFADPAPTVTIHDRLATLAPSCTGNQNAVPLT